MRDDPPRPAGQPITERLARDGRITDDQGLASRGVTAAMLAPETQHQIASVFWAFMQSSGLIWDGEAYVTAPLFESPFYVVGLPITEAYWAHVKVSGTPQDVLVQCFERRCLTYTPDNPDGWQVEAGNVGWHYLQWRGFDDDDGVVGPERRIAFQSNRDGNDEIYVMNGDGSVEANLTKHPAADRRVSWSPDGTKIAFTRYLPGSTYDGELFVMNADGSNQVNLSNHPGMDYVWSWSPDGTRLIANRDEAGIYVINVDGSGLIFLTGPDSFGPVSWSPDGTRIVFTSWRDGNDEIYIMNADGSNQTRLTDSPSWDLGASWSPDGSLIVFTSGRTGISRVWVMNADGSNQSQVSDAWDENIGRVWSPDGTKIAFKAIRHEQLSQATDIWVVNVDGTGQRNLTDYPGHEDMPAWSPDGAWIAFTAYNRDLSSEIYLMRADGSEQQRLTYNLAVDDSPTWAPVSP
jgi:Tol biopolymer transport system component